MPRNLYLFATTLFIGTCALACSDDSGDGGGGGTQLSFAADIHPILVENCGICHGAGLADGDYPAHGSDDVEESFAEVMRNGAQGQKVYERILFRTNAPDVVDLMPPGCGTGLDDGFCLTTEDHDLIEQWVAQGTRP